MPLIRPIGVSGSIPSVNQLALGDIAINTYDGKVYIKKAVGNTQTVVELGTGGGGSSISASYAATASYSFFAITSSYAGTASYALNGGVTKLIAGTNVTLSPVEGTGIVTVNAVLASSGSGTPNGPIYSLQFNSGGVFSGSGNFTLLNNSDLNLTGSLRVSGSAQITGSTAVKGDFSVNGATTIDLNTSVLNINAPTLQVPSFALAYSPSVNVRTVMYDAVSNILFVTSSLPGTGGGGFANYIATGSITASVNVDLNSLFLVKSGSVDLLKVTADKILVLVTQSSTPSAVAGGIYVSSSGDFFFGQ